ncbi:MAG: bifunctional oligoribonuclease/PAP phosphatase NrnA [Clostridium sp.]|nr:bifunctional oligoribonuclease/PAP phosphatase NrnA [Clostridium sp.]MCM1172639.1 bifunctional oligoribonuclease/PAP phosphatase NrnA [Clostridium sp.]MCM1209002.1 bifunctional oligoribonuclease/PAP phosphatase NrnA [Ruminococcus sp.]
MNKELFLKKIEAADTIAVVGHIRPDGDCVGSCLGFYNYITENYPHKTIVVYLEEIAPKFRFLKGACNIVHETCDTVYDLAVSLDCGDTDRHGAFAPVFQNAKDTACLDHHRSNQGFGDYFYCDPDASSTCEIIYRHMDRELISRECAECLYLGIVHDTGVFKYPSTSKKTMEIAGTLIAKGARSQYIIDETFYKVTYVQNKLTGEALLGCGLGLDGKVIFTCITKELFDKYGATKDDTDGIIDKLRVTEGVEVAIFAYQLSEEVFKYSLRSVSYVDVSKIAVSYGGGGHIRAAGFEAAGPYEEVLSRIIDMVAMQL